VTLADRFDVAVMRMLRGRETPPELLPMALSEAAVAVLPVEGAGLSMLTDLRLPLGASDEAVVHAEALQTTLGEGPCLSAAATGKALVADLETMAAKWPVFHEEFVTQTPYRSVASVPLRLDDSRTVGALDLYSTRAEQLDPGFLAEIGAEVVDPIAAILFGGLPLPADADPFTELTWLHHERTNQRMQVWVAVGILMERGRLTNPDALAVLRAYAFSQQTTLDAVAADLVGHKLPAEAFIF
jgi:hypothetical protein